MYISGKRLGLGMLHSCACCFIVLIKLIEVSKNETKRKLQQKKCLSDTSIIIVLHELKKEGLSRDWRIGFAMLIIAGLLSSSFSLSSISGIFNIVQ